MFLSDTLSFLFLLAAPLGHSQTPMSQALSSSPEWERWRREKSQTQTPSRGFLGDMGSNYGKCFSGHRGK